MKPESCQPEGGVGTGREGGRGKLEDTPPLGTECNGLPVLQKTALVGYPTTVLLRQTRFVAAPLTTP